MRSTRHERVIGREWIIESGDTVQLRVTDDPADQTRWFPPVTARGLTSQMTEGTIGPVGVAYASTVVHVSSGRFPAPYVLTYVDIDGVRLLAHSPGADALRPGTEVVLRLGQIGHRDDGPLWSYTAEPLSRHEEGTGS